MLSERLQPPCVPEGTAAVSTSAGLATVFFVNGFWEKDGG